MECSPLLLTVLNADCNRDDNGILMGIIMGIILGITWVGTIIPIRDCWYKGVGHPSVEGL